MILTNGFTFSGFIIDVFSIFMFILWFWLFITIAGDLFSRHDISGFMKVIWVIFLIVLPYIGVFAYILTQGRRMAERNHERAQKARDELRQVVGFSVADELEKLDKLKSTGSLTEDEYTRLRTKLVQ
ncbi:SHOCT domain-containing protein [Paraburkholderia rhizosphaerae]|uniref:Phospholipase D-like protein n=1 Tax=Paraburkholderia rhizosphaerae TaxID=480658 RepID=A0A4R8L4E5_9BURK|nr:SHOCT domain-containing protein [Paraburkholderia rhizosphaerae]TDY37401.1 phospholipase D-like protein [Paraburkholderia rhizosphaerae]